jgi:tetraacyldisaccharide-1-P 4'-kinase
LERLGFKVAHERLLPDHDDLRSRRLFTGFDPMLPVVVTEKDWMKMQHRDDLATWNVLIARYDVQLEPIDGFREWLRGRLDGVDK